MTSKRSEATSPQLFDRGPPTIGCPEAAGNRTASSPAYPRRCPAFLLAYRLQERAATVGLDWPDATRPLAKVAEELGEVEQAIKASKTDKTNAKAPPPAASSVRLPDRRTRESTSIR